MLKNPVQSCLPKLPGMDNRVPSTQDPHPALHDFHPLVRQWFHEEIGRPTTTQIQAWPRIGSREHLLITAPTGSGKTLTAFLSVINRFLVGELETGTTRVLYISPLKALNNDIERNLIRPLADLHQRFLQSGVDMPSIRVATRSGDTEQSARQRMLRRPPEILITTPETINLLLTSAGGRQLLQNLDTVILDEIHAVADSKRGTHLITAVERLTRLSGEFQRLALSATVRPLQLIAAFVGGYQFDGKHHRPRPVGIVESGSQKHYVVAVSLLSQPREPDPDRTPWHSLAEELVPRIRSNRSTLIFVNTRVLTERLTLSINRLAGETLAWAHHGSLSQEVRREVEQRLKSGGLAAIVATSSLEMGIDIGTLDEVILVQSPHSIAAALQRVGRAGHQVGAVSKGHFYTLDPLDLLQSGVLAKGIRENAIETLLPVSQPLDVLAQVLISMVSQEARTPEDLYQEVRCAWPYQELPCQQFERVLDMLAGRLANGNIRELQSRVAIDRLSNQVSARRGAVKALYLSGGTIPERGYYQIRHFESDARIGELDEEFVWEARVGQAFTFGNQQWQITRITHNDVVVRAFKGAGPAPPFWRAESVNRSLHLSERLGDLLETAETCLAIEDRDRLLDLLQRTYHLETSAAAEAIDFLVSQREHTRTALPHRHHLLVELVTSGIGGDGGDQLVVHNFWGGRVNRPLAMAMQAAWQNRFHHQLEIFPTNDALVLQLPNQLQSPSLLELVTPEELHGLLAQRLEGSNFFGARFRECAGRALLIGKRRFNERKPLWMTRLQAQKLAESTRCIGDFPILHETWRTCLQDEFELDSLSRLLEEIRDGSIRVSTVITSGPSPMAKSLAWEQIQKYMYADDTPQTDMRTSLSSQLIAELTQREAERPRLDSEVVRQFLLRRQRLAGDYAPSSATDLIEWVKERVAVPLGEWRQLLTGMGDASTAILAEADMRLLHWRGLILATERLPEVSLALTESTPDFQLIEPLLKTDISAWQHQLARLLEPLTVRELTLDQFLTDWLTFYGPISVEEISRRLQLPPDRLEAALTRLLEQKQLIQGQLLQEQDHVFWCDAACYASLLRLARRSREPLVEPLPLISLPNLIRNLHHYRTTDKVELLDLHLDRIQGYAVAPAAWERDLLPARCPDYEPVILDQLLQETQFCWIGRGDRKLTFIYPANLDLLTSRSSGQRQPLRDAQDPEQLWQQVWQGQLHADDFLPVRQGIANGFGTRKATARKPRRSSWRSVGHRTLLRQGVPVLGNWQPPPWPQVETKDLLIQEDLKRDRARLLIRRYGIVFRTLLRREEPGLRWDETFRALRYMEFAGEVIAGLFYQGVDGLQFASPQAVEQLQSGRRQEVFWLAAMDPASPSGISSRLNREQTLPRRTSGNYLVYHGDRLVATVERHGSQVQFRVEPDDPELPRYLCVHEHLLYRKVQPMTNVELQTINDRPASGSPYLRTFERLFDVYADHRAVTLQGHIQLMS